MICHLRCGALTREGVFGALFLISGLFTPPAGAVTVSLGTAVSSPDFNYSFQSGFADSNLTWSVTTPGFVQFANSSLGVGQASIRGYFDFIGIPTTSYGAYFTGDAGSAARLNMPLTITTTSGQDLTGLSFLIGSGYGGTIFSYWEAYRDGSLLGSGSFTAPQSPVSYVAFADSVGFDKILIGTYFQPFTSFSGPFGNGNALVAADAAGIYSPAVVPIPAALPLFAGGLGLLAWMSRRRRLVATLGDGS